MVTKTTAASQRTPAKSVRKPSAKWANPSVGPSSRLSQVVRDKVVVVTGASSGIGHDCALKLGAAGAVVILTARTPEKLAQTVASIERRGGRAVPTPATSPTWPTATDCARRS